jgi:hypothetical protein
MAAGASVTWTHCSVLFEVTWAKTDLHPRGHRPVRADELTSLPSPSLPSPSSADTVCCPRGHQKKNKLLLLFYFFGSCCRLGKREKIFNFQFSVFNPQTPQTPWASRPKPQEEEGSFGLVPLVTHPSSIPLLGGLTPKFLSLSLHSL